MRITPTASHLTTGLRTRTAHLRALLHHHIALEARAVLAALLAHQRTCATYNCMER